MEHSLSDLLDFCDKLRDMQDHQCADCGVPLEVAPLCIKTVVDGEIQSLICLVCANKHPSISHEE